MASAGFEPTIPEIKQLQNCALDRMTSWIGLMNSCDNIQIDFKEIVYGLVSSHHYPHVERMEVLIRRITIFCDCLY
jgi:hypothetical protein